MLSSSPCTISGRATRGDEDGGALPATLHSAGGHVMPVAEAANLLPLDPRLAVRQFKHADGGGASRLRRQRRRHLYLSGLSVRRAGLGVPGQHRLVQRTNEHHRRREPAGTDDRRRQDDSCRRGRRQPDRLGATGIFYCGSMVRVADITDGRPPPFWPGEKYMNSDQYETGVDIGDNECALTGEDDDIARWTDKKLFPQVPFPTSGPI